MNKQVIEIILAAQTPSSACKVSEGELQVVAVYLNEFLVELLAKLDNEE